MNRSVREKKHNTSHITREKNTKQNKQMKTVTTLKVMPMMKFCRKIASKQDAQTASYH